MYRAVLVVRINRENLSKLKGMLTEKWKAQEITIQGLADRWNVSFVTSDHRKVFAFEKVVENYGGTVLQRWIAKIRGATRHNARL